jgi:ribosomal protein L11 methyltransferase
LNNNYICIQVSTSNEMSEVLIALLGELPFDTFEENASGFNAYIKTADYNAEVKAEIKTLQNNFGFSFSEEEIEAQNWNEVWESNFHPIEIDDFCGIRADFHQPMQHLMHEIVINPKMAFGTGHHETTHMMIQTMRDMDFQEKKVFDYGCGTGILAIMAGKLGATELIGVDNEYPAYESTIENAELNGIPHIKSIFGTLNDVKESGFDVILANINRNIIVNSLATLYEKLNPNAYILLSGFLKEDEDHMKNALAQQQLEFVGMRQRGNWICIKAKK